MIGSTYLEFDKAQGTGIRLIRSDENPTFGLLIVVGINLGLRISDLLDLSFCQLRADSITIKEGKTGKSRTLKVNANIHTALEYFKEEPNDFHAFRSQKGTVYSSQHVNRLMKKYFKGSDISSHSLRKAFGRRVWDASGQTDAALTKLSEIFNHSTTAITRRYLGIRQQELDDVYMNL